MHRSDNPVPSEGLGALLGISRGIDPSHPSLAILLAISGALSYSGGDCDLTVSFQKAPLGISCKLPFIICN